MNNPQKLHKFLYHQLFYDASTEFGHAQCRQIKKAAEKYNEPLNPDSWAPDQLHWHAMEELVDLAHYLQAMKVKMKQMEQDIYELLDFIQPENDCYPSPSAKEWLEQMKNKYALHRIVDLAEGGKKEGV